MRGNGSHACLTTKIDIHNRDGQKIGEKEVATYSGILALAHDEGLRSVRTELVQAPTKENGMVAIVTAVVRTNKGVFTGIGDANPGNVNRKIAAHIIRMAETRAKARALRDAVNIGIVSLEELGELVDDELSSEPLVPSDRPPARPRPQASAPSESHPANDNGASAAKSDLPTATESSFQEMTAPQRGRLFRIAGDRGVAPDAALAWLLAQLGIKDLHALSRADASRAISRLENAKPNGTGSGANGAGALS